MYHVTADERTYLLFLFGLLNRIITSEAIVETPMMRHYEAMATAAWHMEEGGRTVAQLAAVHARAAGAYEVFGRIEHRAVLSELQAKEQRSPDAGKTWGLPLTPPQAQTFFAALFRFFGMTLAKTLRSAWDADGVRLLYRELCRTLGDRQRFLAFACDQCAAMGLAPSAMAAVLRAERDPAARPCDAQTVAVITCVNDEARYSACRSRLAQLVLPEGMALDFVPVRHAASMCAGYEEGRIATDAKYKLYLHQDMLLEQPEVLRIIMPYFQQHPEVGLIGLAGSRVWRANGIWWEDPSIYLHLKEGDGVKCPRRQLAIGTMAGAWLRVAMLDGIFLMTQADVPWRADRFRGWHFYDASACAEYRRAGYEIAVPRQDTPWFTHLGGGKELDDVYHYWRGVFLETYGDDIAKN